MLAVVTWLWSTPGRPRVYLPEHVNALARQVHRNYIKPHRFIVVTNVPGPFAHGVEVVADREDFAGVVSPEGATRPSCYRRLLAFHPDAARWFGERFVSIDLDSVLLADLVPLWDRSEDFVIYRDPVWRAQGQGSMFMLRAGTRPHVWTDFDPMRSPAIARAHGYRGSDQAWISYCTPGRSTWSAEDGVYSFRRDVMPRTVPPPGARVVSFHGRPKPWDAAAASLRWVRDALAT